MWGRRRRDKILLPKLLIPGWQSRPSGILPNWEMIFQTTCKVSATAVDPVSPKRQLYDESSFRVKLNCASREKRCLAYNNARTYSMCNQQVRLRTAHYFYPDLIIRVFRGCYIEADCAIGKRNASESSTVHGDAYLQGNTRKVLVRQSVIIYLRKMNK